MCGSALANACHFFLLGFLGPATLYLIMTGRIATSAFTTDRRMMYLFLILIFIGFIMSYQRPLDILAMAGASLATFGTFQASARLVRLVYMACAGIWIIHNMLAGTPVAVAMEAAFLISNILGYLRHCRSETSHGNSAELLK